MSNRLNGGVTHGILAMLNSRGAQGARAKEITASFPSTDGASTLTIMRRGGLIAKAGVKQTTPWIITVKGQELLATLIPYTTTHYWRQVFYGTEMKEIEQRFLEHPGYYGKRTTTSLFGWDQPDFTNRDRSGSC